MKLIRHIDWRGNFGDDLNVPFFSQNAPGYEAMRPDLNLYGIGTLLNNVHGRIENSVIFGSGFGYGEVLEFDERSCKIFGVRGPITAKKLQISEKSVIGDPAFYVECMPSLSGGRDLAAGVGVVVALNHRSCELWDFRPLNSDKFYFLDPGDVSISDYLSTIKNAKLVIAESLHAAIIASMYGTPYIPLSIRAPVDATKWADFGASLELDFGSIKQVEPLRIPFIRRVRVSRYRSKLDSIFGKSIYGVPLQPGTESRAFLSALEAVSSKEKPIEVQKIKIRLLQEKIAAALADLNTFMAQR